MTPIPKYRAALCCAALVLGCGKLADGSYQPPPFGVIEGTLVGAQPGKPYRNIALALSWSQGWDHRDVLLDGSEDLPPDGVYSLTCTWIVPFTRDTCDGTPAAGMERCHWTDLSLLGLVQAVAYEPIFPLDFRIPVEVLPPTPARFDLSAQGGSGVFALATLIAFEDGDADGGLRMGTPDDPPDRVLANSGAQEYAPPAGTPRRSYFVAFLDGRIDLSRVSPMFDEVLREQPQGFSIWVRETWFDEFGRPTAVRLASRPIGHHIDLIASSSTMTGCTEGVLDHVYLSALPDGVAPTRCRADGSAHWYRLRTTGICTQVGEEFDANHSCAPVPPPEWNCPALDPSGANGALVIAVASRGEDLDANGYRFTVSELVEGAIAPNGSAAIHELPPGAYAVGIDGLAPNCAVVGANPTDVSVTAGEYAVAAFEVECVAIGGSGGGGTLRVSVTTTGEDLDPDGYAVAIDGRPAGAIGPTGVLNLSAVEPGIRSVSLGGIAPNCSVVGSNPLPVALLPEATAHAEFSVECVAAGSVSVFISTSGVDLDPDGFRATLTRSGFTQTLDVATNGSATATQLAGGSYQVALGDVAPNCTAIGPATLTVFVVAGTTVNALFGVACVRPTRLAFVTWSPLSRHYAIVTSDGSGAATFMTESEAGRLADLAWSPDGSRLAFTSQRDGNSEIYVANADGSGIQRLTVDPAPDGSPAWAPDGTRLAFVSERDGNAEIYVMNSDGTNPVRVTNDPAHEDSSPSWAPDGSRIAFAKGTPGALFTDPIGIHLMNADGTNVVRLTPVSYGEEERQPAWSPDGTRIAFRRTDGDVYSYILVMDADGTGGAPLVLDYDIDTRPAWSPDGLFIAFTRASYYLYDVWIRVVRADGTDAVNVAAGWEPSWRP